MLAGVVLEGGIDHPQVEFAGPEIVARGGWSWGREERVGGGVKRIQTEASTHTYDALVVCQGLMQQRHAGWADAGDVVEGMRVGRAFMEELFQCWQSIFGSRAKRVDSDDCLMPWAGGPGGKKLKSLCLLRRYKSLVFNPVHWKTDPCLG